MRTALAAVAALIAAAAFPQAAAAQSDFDFAFDTQRTARAAGFQAVLETGSEENPPPRSSAFKLYLPAGSRINLTGAPQCTAPFEAREQLGHETVCPPNTRVGGGRAVVLFGDQRTNVDLQLWNVFNPQQNRSVINVERFSNGNRLPFFTTETTKRAILFPFGASSPILRVNVNVRRSARNGRALVRTPRSCPRGGWRSAVRVRYEDGSTDTFRTRTACLRRSGAVAPSLTG